MYYVFKYSKCKLKRKKNYNHNMATFSIYYLLFIYLLNEFKMFLRTLVDSSSYTSPVEYYCMITPP